MEFLTPLIGGVLIGLGSILALAASGRIPGISGVIARILRPGHSRIAWRIVFLVGIVAGAWLTSLSGFGWQEYVLPAGRSVLFLAIAGFLVGFGARLGGGCTSGHGVCGIGAGARDGLVYTLVFMATAMLTVVLWNLVQGGGTSL